MRVRRFTATLMLFAVAACNLKQEPPVTVEVYPNRERCVVREVAVTCASVGKYLREELRIPRDRQINIAMYRIAKTHSPKDVEYVTDVVRVAGFSNVQPWHFAFK